MRWLWIPLLLLALAAIGGGTAWYLLHTSEQAAVPTTLPTVSEEEAEGLSIYTNGTYGFTFFYPASADIAFTFSEEDRLGTVWRRGAPEAQAGIPIVSVTTYSIQQENAYPRSYRTLVRVGVSDTPEAVRACETADTSLGETELLDVVINGYTWSAFAFQDAAMQQYVEGVSYRTVHEGVCIAVEKARTGSSYRDEANAADISDEALAEEYTALENIIQSFSFARP